MQRFFHPSFFHSSSSAATSLALTALALAITAGIALPGNVRASAFQLKEDSAKGMGRAYAGSLTAGEDVSVVANGPASMSDVKGTRLQMDITAIKFDATFKGSAVDSQGRPIKGGNGGNAGGTIPVPAFFLVTQPTERLHVGFGVNVPFGFQTKYKRGWVGRYNGMKSRFQSLDATLSASWDVTRNFSLGASVIAQKTNVELTSVVNINGAGYLTLNNEVREYLRKKKYGPAAIKAMLDQMKSQIDMLTPPGTDGTVSLKAHNLAWGWQLGGYWKLTPDDRIALNYRSEIKHKLKGNARFTVPPAAQKSLVVFAALLDWEKSQFPFRDTKGDAVFTTPRVITGSYWHQSDKFGVGVDVAWTQWDVFKNITVTYDNPNQPKTVDVKNWDNSLYTSVGGDYYLTNKLTLRGGLAFDSTPTYSKTRDVRVPDFNRKMLSLGVGYQPTRHLDMDVSYVHVFKGVAVLDGSPSPTGDVVTGEYKGYADVLALSAQYRF